MAIAKTLPLLLFSALFAALGCKKNGGNTTTDVPKAGGPSHTGTAPWPPSDKTEVLLAALRRGCDWVSGESLRVPPGTLSDFLRRANAEVEAEPESRARAKKLAVILRHDRSEDIPWALKELQRVDIADYAYNTHTPGPPLSRVWLIRYLQRMSQVPFHSINRNQQRRPLNGNDDALIEPANDEVVNDIIEFFKEHNEGKEIGGRQVTLARIRACSETDTFAEFSAIVEACLGLSGGDRYAALHEIEIVNEHLNKIWLWSRLIDVAGPRAEPYLWGRLFEYLGLKEKGRYAPSLEFGLSVAMLLISHFGRYDLIPLAVELLPNAEGDTAKYTLQIERALLVRRLGFYPTPQGTAELEDGSVMVQLSNEASSEHRIREAFFESFKCEGEHLLRAACGRATPDFLQKLVRDAQLELITPGMKKVLAEEVSRYVMWNEGEDAARFLGRLKDYAHLLKWNLNRRVFE